MFAAVLIRRDLFQMDAVDNVIQEQVLRVAQQFEKQVDAEIQKLDELDTDGIEKLRQDRLDELKKHAKQKQHWLSIVSNNVIISFVALFYSICWYI